MQQKILAFFSEKYYCYSNFPVNSNFSFLDGKLPSIYFDQVCMKYTHTSNTTFVSTVLYYSKVQSSHTGSFSWSLQLHGMQANSDKELISKEEKY